jgi:N-acetylmuramic acid 6-phosphate etherase
MPGEVATDARSMSEYSQRRAEEFLKISGQFKLGTLTTESSHPATASLSEVAKRDIAAALKLLFDVDDDVIRKYREFVESGRAAQIADAVLAALANGGRIFFTGCGSTGRLSIQLVSIWRDFWQRQATLNHEAVKSLNRFNDLENRAFPVMAGGDFALIKSVEGFEDFTNFGKKQLGDLGVCDKDVVFAITEGGETSFVIGTAWKGVEVGAKVYFVYNNPDDVLCQHVERSLEVIEDPRIEKINLTTGPMAITGSTRMQATSIQLTVLLTVLEMVVRELGRDALPRIQADQRVSPIGYVKERSASLTEHFLGALEALHATLKSPSVLAQLAKLVVLEQ